MRRHLISFVWRASLLLPLAALPLLNRLDAAGRQLLFQWRGPIASQGDVVLLGIDEASLDPDLSEFGPWPWPRAVQASLAREVLSKGARRVVFNIVHVGPSSYGPDDDRAFRDALQPWQDRILLSASFVRQQLEGLEQVQLRRPWVDSYQVGLSAFSMDAFGVVQSVPGMVSLSSMLTPFPLPHPRPLAHLAADVGTSPGDDGIDFLGPSGHMPIIPAWAVGTLSEATWRDKIVILGSTAPSLGDQLETPFGQQSGSEVLLSAISGLQHGPSNGARDGDQHRCSGAFGDSTHCVCLVFGPLAAGGSPHADAPRRRMPSDGRSVSAGKFATQISPFRLVPKGVAKPHARHAPLGEGDLDAFGWTS